MTTDTKDSVCSPPTQHLDPQLEDNPLVNGKPARIRATNSARTLIREIRLDHGDILFHQSGGCCDGSSPMCYPANDFRIGQTDRLLGHIDNTPFYMGGQQFEYWKHTQLILDVVPGRGGMFSLDNGREKRFLVRSRTFSTEEMRLLEDS